MAYAKEVQGVVGGTPVPVIPGSSSAAMRVNLFSVAGNELVDVFSQRVLSCTLGGGGSVTDNLVAPTMFLANDGTFANRPGAVGAVDYDGGAWNRHRGNAKNTADNFTNPGIGAQNGAAIQLFNGRGVVVYVNISAIAGGATVTVKLQEQDPQSLNWVDIAGATTLALAAVALTALRVYPGITVAANVAVNNVPGRTVRAVSTLAVANNATWTVMTVELQ